MTRWTITTTTPAGRAWPRLSVPASFLLAWHRWVTLALRLLG